MIEPTKSALGWRRARLRVFWLLLFFLPAIAAVVLLLLYRPDPRVYSMAELTSERLSFDVVDPRKAAFYVAGVKIGNVGASPGKCASGLFTPALGTTVTIGRAARGLTEIAVIPPTGGDRVSTAVGVLETADGQPAKPFKGELILLTDKTCAPPPVQRFPVWGPLIVGQEFRPSSGADAASPSFLLSGKLEIAAHTIFWTTPYQVTTVTLPVGGRLQANDPADARAMERSVWWGTATVDGEHNAIDLALATEAHELALSRPNQTTADIIRLSTLTELTKDPSYLLIASIVAAVLFLLDKCIDLSGFVQSVYDEHRGRRARPAASSTEEK